MSLTKAKDAGRKWCPFSRIARRETNEPYARAADQDTVIGGVNRDALGTKPGGGSYLFPHSTRCFGSDCMAWRSVGEHGYCGMAGPPPDLTMLDEDAQHAATLAAAKSELTQINKETANARSRE